MTANRPNRLMPVFVTYLPVPMTILPGPSEAPIQWMPHLPGRNLFEGNLRLHLCIVNPARTSGEVQDNYKLLSCVVAQGVDWFPPAALFRWFGCASESTIQNRLSGACGVQTQFHMKIQFRVKPEFRGGGTLIPSDPA